MCINCYNFWLAIPQLFEYKYIYVDFVSHSNYFFLLAKTYAVLGWFQRLYSVFHPQLAMGLLYLYFLYISRDTTYELSLKKKGKQITIIKEGKGGDRFIPYSGTELYLFNNNWLSSSITYINISCWHGC